MAVEKFFNNYLKWNDPMKVVTMHHFTVFIFYSRATKIAIGWQSATTTNSITVAAYLLKRIPMQKIFTSCHVILFILFINNNK